MSTLLSGPQLSHQENGDNKKHLPCSDRAVLYESNSDPSLLYNLYNSMLIMDQYRGNSCISIQNYQTNLLSH